MKKRHNKLISYMLVIVLVFSMIGLFPSQKNVYAQSYSNQQDFDAWLGTQSIPTETQGGNHANYHVYNVYQQVVYGKPLGRWEAKASGQWRRTSSGDSSWHQSGEIGEYEYLGYTLNDLNYSNSAFRNDEITDGFPHTSSFILYPDQNASKFAKTKPYTAIYTRDNHSMN